MTSADAIPAVVGAVVAGTLAQLLGKLGSTLGRRSPGRRTAPPRVGQCADPGPGGRSVGRWLRPAPILAVTGIVLLALVCANAVNIVDGQDVLAGGLAAIAALGLSILAAGHGDAAAVAVGLALVGSLLSFWVLGMLAGGAAGGAGWVVRLWFRRMSVT